MWLFYIIIQKEENCFELFAVICVCISVVSTSRKQSVVNAGLLIFTGRQDVDADIPAEYAGPETVSTF